MNPTNKQIKEVIKFLKKFMNFNRNQQLEIIKELERKLKENDK